MPRYFFHIHDGRFDPDLTGTELPDVHTAHLEAIRTSGAMLRDKGLKLWDHRSWAMMVRDEADRLLFTLQVSIDAPGSPFR